MPPAANTRRPGAGSTSSRHAPPAKRWSDCDHSPARPKTSPSAATAVVMNDPPCASAKPAPVPRSRPRALTANSWPEATNRSSTHGSWVASDSASVPAVRNAPRSPPERMALSSASAMARTGCAASRSICAPPKATRSRPSRAPMSSSPPAVSASVRTCSRPKPLRISAHSPPRRTNRPPSADAATSRPRQEWSADIRRSGSAADRSVRSAPAATPKPPARMRPSSVTATACTSPLVATIAAAGRGGTAARLNAATLAGAGAYASFTCRRSATAATRATSATAASDAAAMRRGFNVFGLALARKVNSSNSGDVWTPHRVLRIL